MILGVILIVVASLLVDWRFVKFVEVDCLPDDVVLVMKLDVDCRCNSNPPSADDGLDVSCSSTAVTNDATESGRIVDPLSVVKIGSVRRGDVSSSSEPVVLRKAFGFDIVVSCWSAFSMSLETRKVCSD
jgi:hypothetical protein